MLGQPRGEGSDGACVTGSALRPAIPTSTLGGRPLRLDEVSHSHVCDG